MWFYVENVTVFVGGFFPSSFLWHCSNQLSSIFVKRERSERASEKRTRPPINCSDNEYNVDRRSFSWIFIHRVVFLLLISKFQSECRTPSVPSKCFLRLRSENYSIFLCVCWCCAMASKIVARRTILDSKREWIFVGKLYANHTQISKCLAFLAILIVYALHCIALYLCASFLLYDFCQSLFPYMITLRFYMWIFLVAYRMLLIILTVKQAR